LDRLTTREKRANREPSYPDGNGFNVRNMLTRRDAGRK